MNISPYKSFSTGETLTSSDLNSSFLQITNHTITNSDIDSTGAYVLGTLVVGTGLTSADGKLHVHSASAGSVTANGDADEMVLENSGASGLTVLSGASSSGSIFFGDSGDNDIGKVSYSHSSNALTFTTNATTALTLSSSQVATFAGLVTANVGAEVKNGATSAGFIKFYEDSDNGSNAVTLIGPASTADVTLTLPSITDTLISKTSTDTLTNKTLTSAVLNTGVSGTAVLDEDNMASDSATKLATQQSIKAYVDASGSGTIGGSTGSTDQIIITANGTGGSTVQANSAVVIDDSSNITGVGTLSTGAITVGSDGSGADVIFYSGTAGDNFHWDASEEKLTITGTNGQLALDIADGDVKVVDKLYLYDAGGEYLSSDGSNLKLTSGGNTYTWPTSPTNNYYLQTDGSGNLSWAAVSSGGGDFSGPGSSTDHALVRFDGTGGKTGINSGIIVTDANDLSGANSITMADGKEIVFGSNDDIKIEYDEAGYDSLLIQAGVNDAPVSIVLSADASADAGDDWKINAANGGVLTFGNDIASAGTFVSGVTITPHATATSWELAFVGEISADSLDIEGNVDINGVLESDSITVGGTNLTALYSPIAGSGSIVTTGALNSGSITSGFGNINIGSSTITTTGALNSGATTVTGTLAVGNGATSAGKIELYEDTDDGAHKLTLTTPALAGDVTLTFPNTDGDADQVLTTNGSGALSWTTASSGGASLSGSTATTIPTVTGSNALAGEANLRYDDKILSVDGASAGFDTTMTGIQCESAFFGGQDGHSTNSEWWSNVYYDSSAYKYISSDNASRYRQQSGTHTWYGAGSGSADAAITWTTLSYWDSSGNVDFYASGGTAFSVGTSTPRKPGGGDWTASSDSRLKNVVGEYTLGLTELCNSNVRPIKYQYNGKADTSADNKTYVGLIAQEVEQVFPDTVIQYSAKMNESDENETTDLRMFDAGEIRWALVNAVKELKTELDAAKARITILEGS